MIERQLRNLDETAEFARALAASLRPGDVVLLDGPLGAGKTTLVRAAAAAMGVDPEEVSSPTFVLVHEHATRIEDRDGPTLVHVDAYRMEGDDEGELDLLGWDRIASGGAIVLVEWGGRIVDLLEGSVERGAIARLELTPTGEHERSVRISMPEAWSSRPQTLALSGGTGTPAEGDRWDTECPVTGDPVAATSPCWPFSSERARWADLYRWMHEGYRIERPITEADLEQGE